jgi:hypothetical protein
MGQRGSLVTSTVAGLLMALPSDLALAEDRASLVRGIDQNIRAFDGCLKEKAVTLDDGHSDAASIAAGTVSACISYMRRANSDSAKLFGVPPPLPGSQQEIADQQRLEKEAITVVLQARAKNTAHTQ